VKHVLGDIIAIEDNQAVLLTYFRNNIVHSFVLPSLIAALVEHNGMIRREDAINASRTLYPFLKAELFLKWKEDEIQQHVDAYIAALITTNLISDDRENVIAPAPNTEAQHEIEVLARPATQSLERYYITLAFNTQRGPAN